MHYTTRSPRVRVVALPVCLKKEEVVLLLNKTRLFFVMLLSLSSFAFTQVETTVVGASTDTAALLCAPPLYSCARNDLIKTDNLNPVPSVTKSNTIVTPSDFKLPIVRITDSSTFRRESMSASISGSSSDNMFNTDDTYFMVADNNGWKYPVAFNPSTMQVVNRGPWKIGANQVRWGGSGSFSRSKRSVVYAGQAPTFRVSSRTARRCMR
jgi:hypothetical protein